ncbi:phosphoethanolamine transferase [uncultured Alistipes sp.]|uniref:phosphoethanolamine transferase n=1 Tax=uncultured Alistipes sp. TaxID=538949 RepID=UPI002630379E|nr:phosphoethanolamine transferase [uncultured Alistipes sp.]
MERDMDNPRSNRPTTILTVYYLVAMMIPNAILFFTEPYCGWSKAALLLLPLGCYMLWSAAFRRVGVAIWLSFPVILFCALQIVLLYLFGNSVAATDMFINIITTNPGEANELLSNIYPAVLMVCAFYLPLLVFGSCYWYHRAEYSGTFRRRMGFAGGLSALVGFCLLIPVYGSGRRVVLRNDIFPVNVGYNVWLCMREYARIKNYDETSAGFTYHARRTAEASKREIYVYVIGEAARAANWELYGYDRPTNPRLKAMGDRVVVFRNMLTQSNTTHKSVPLILSSVRTEEHDELFRRTGLPALFKEAGFRTWFLSNQSPQGAMIDNLARDADSLVYLKHPRFDQQLLDTMKRVIAEDRTHDLLFILHCYGSHFSYYQRYPREAAYFRPDGDVAVERQHKHKLWNSYDNSIRYTDEFLASMIDYLSSLDACSALLYSSDHGEDLLDDERDRFLHASPTTTCWQLHIASLAWFSDEYIREFPQHAAAAASHENAPATTHALFHTMADIAHIDGDYVDRTSSLASPEYDTLARRYYLNDHNRAVPFPRTGLNETDLDYFRRRGIEL